MSVIEAFPTAFLPSGRKRSTAAFIGCGYLGSHKQLEIQTSPAQAHDQHPPEPAQSDSALPGQKLLSTHTLLGNTSVISYTCYLLFYIYRNFCFFLILLSVDLPFPRAVPPYPDPCCLSPPFLSPPLRTSRELQQHRGSEPGAKAEQG